MLLWLELTFSHHTDVNVLPPATPPCNVSSSQFQNNNKHGEINYKNPYAVVVRDNTNTINLFEWFIVIFVVGIVVVVCEISQ